MKCTVLKSLFAASLLVLSMGAQAAFGVAIGANEFADDGMPQLGPKEQAKLFYCHAKNSKMSGPQAQACAVRKCMAHFKVPANASLNRFGAVGGKCKAEGWSERPGWAIGYIGDPGDNVYISDRVHAQATREEAMKLLGQDNFPLKERNKVFDFYDDGHNGTD